MKTKKLKLDDFKIEPHFLNRFGLFTRRQLLEYFTACLDFQQMVDRVNYKINRSILYRKLLLVTAENEELKKRVENKNSDRHIN